MVISMVIKALNYFRHCRLGALLLDLCAGQTEESLVSKSADCRGIPLTDTD